MRALRNWLIEVLGGLAFEEAQRRVDAARGDYKEERAYFTDLLRDKDVEIQRLTNLMLARTGFIQPDRAMQAPPTHEPINKRRSWAERQHDLEVQDAKRHADEVERRWKTKGGLTDASQESEAV